MSISASSKHSLTRFITSSAFSFCGFTIPSIRRHWRLEYCSNSSHLVLISFCSFEHCSLRTSTVFWNSVLLVSHSDFQFAYIVHLLMTLCLIANFFQFFHKFLTLSGRRQLSYRNQSIDLQNKSMDWFLYDNGLRHKEFKSANLLSM